MAAIDPSIALGVKPLQLDNPMNAMAMYSQIQGAQQANQLNQMKMAEYERARAEEEGIRNYLAGGADLSAPETRTGLLRYGKTGLEYGKALAEQDKLRTELTEKRLKVAADKTTMFRDALADVNTPQQAAMWLTAQHQDPDLKPIVSSLRPLDQALASIPTDAKGFADWKAKNALGMNKFIERSTMTAYEKARIGQEQQRLNQEATSVVYQQDANGNVVALPSKLKAGEVPRARVAAAPGVGMTPLEGKPSEAVAKERGSINQQKSIISGALTELKNNPDAFGTTRGMLGATVGESAAGKMYETPEETQARAFIFNTVSNVIHERAGTAQSAGERDTLMRFLPSEYDNAKQIEDKLKGYQKWLTAKEAGTGHRKSESPKPAGDKGGTVAPPAGFKLDTP
jgi:hypothetical protein